MASSRPSQSETCSDESPTGGVSLPVVDTRRIRKSRAGKRRALVLLAVNLLIVLHVVQWYFGDGNTLSPLEPSEAMEFSKHGIINAGLIFFALAILSTMILGRWFCGWGCHLVALQDLSRWLLGKLKIKPKPARIGLLALVPLIAFMYMFVGPVVWRAVHDVPTGEREVRLMTEEFWATFPNEWLPIVLTFLACGFVIIYVMGSKGFCNFGCPYGAIFGVADQFAVWRIRVTDACRGCGHCTAVCTSNVRVHQEVRDFGMVVDPGCMKCNDCISVCPNDALYFGPGKPALFATQRTERPPAPQFGAGAARALPRWILTAAYIFASFGLLMWFDGQVNLLVIAILTAGSLVIAAAFKGKSDRLQGYSLPEEALACVLFLAAVYAFRGLYGQVPFLFCLGLAAIAAYLGVEFARLVYKSNLSIHQWRLKRSGRLAGAGYAFVVIMLGVFSFGAYAASGHKPMLAQRYFAQGAALASQERLPEAIEMFERALAWQRDYRPARTKLAGLYCADRRYKESIELCRRSLEQDADDAEAHFFLGWAYAETKRFDLAEQHLRRATELAPQWPAPQSMLRELTAPPAVVPDQRVEAEVLTQMLDQPIGRQTLAALNLPEEFLGRAVDRVIRSSYRQRFHVVVQDDAAAAPPGEGLSETANAPTQTGAVGEQAIRVLHNLPAETVLAYRRSLPEVRPSLRGFRAPILGNARVTLPIHEPSEPEPAVIRKAADVVATNLARNGLLPTLAEVIRVLGPAGFAAETALPNRLALLRNIGLPVDLLASFPPPNEQVRVPHAIVSFVARRLMEGVSDDALGDELRELPFRFIKSRPDYRVATESGEHNIGLIRLQATRGSYWRGIGCGDGIDIARQLVERLPDASFLLSIETKHLDGFIELAKGWPWKRREQLTICAEPLIVSQWAQDNGKSGTVGAGESGGQQPATLVPRYASRREDGTVFVPGETFLADGLAAAGHAVVQSPLLFQGGNLLAVRDPKTDERILLIGEAEIYRNTALGLTHEQVLQAFATEFDVDRCVVLPAVSFHIDFDLTVRAHGGKLIAFVNDDDRAVRLILELGTEALVSHGVLDAATAQNAKADLRAGRSRAFLKSILDNVFRQANAAGHFPLSLANRFSAGPADSPVGNLQRFLVALDILAAQTLAPAEWPGNRHAQAYMRSLRRRSADRRALHEQLRRLGWNVVPVPSLANADRGINYLNGLHEPKRYIMPAYGRFYAPLDEAA
ncbi:MAG: tetratricopeptide repeat protein, partial [Planctomycetes bacterium]|nr:tetratricopeptide repeat protein [Planctomycetota bacterium]